MLSAPRADAGMSPRQATFLFEQPKRKAKKLPLMPASLRFVALRSGQPAVLGREVCGGTRYALARYALTAAANQFTKQLRSTVQLPPHALCSSAHSEGWVPKQIASL